MNINIPPVDPVFYRNNILQAVKSILDQNAQAIGQDFYNRFSQDYVNNPNKVNELWGYVYTSVVRANGNDSVRDAQQMFDIVRPYIERVFQMYHEAMRSQQFGGGFNRQQGGFGQPSGGGFGFAQSQGPMGAANYLDGGSAASSTMSQPSSVFGNPPAREQTQNPPTTTAAPIMNTTTVEYVKNPSDDLEPKVEFIPVSANSLWGSELPKDNRITIGHRRDQKSKDGRVVIQAAVAYHHDILNDPMQVVQDFFSIAPESALGSLFVYSVNYNHLEILALSTKDFLEVREKCIKARERDDDVLLHKKIMDSLKTMQVGPYEAVSAYLVKRINRALFLSAKLHDNPGSLIQIGNLNDLEELLSSSFNHSITYHPDGRSGLEKIVANAIWNSLVENVGVMFEDGDTLPTHAIQSSPAFPHSMKGVYPNKYAIPTPQSSDAEEFLKLLQEHELSKRTYLLERRRVVFTNMFGKRELSAIGSKPVAIQTPLAPILHMTNNVLDFYDPSRGRSGYDARKPVAVKPYASEDAPEEQLVLFQSDPDTVKEKEMEFFGRMPPILLPVDQTVVAIQYGVKAEKYLKTLDVFSTIDGAAHATTSLILANKSVPVLHPTA